MRTRYHVALFSLLGLMACSSSATAAGINLSWDDCGSHGVQNKEFACTSNSGSRFTLFASFVPPSGINRFGGVAGQIDFMSWAPTLPNWWKFGTAECRGGTALATSVDFVNGPYNCTDVFVGRGASAFAYDIGFGTPNRARFRFQAALPAEDREALDPDTEYYAIKVSIDRTRSTGAGSCSGCCSRMDIVIREIQLFQSIEEGNDPTIYSPLNSQFTTWQVASSCEVTPSHTKTWGQVKSLWR